MFKVFLVVQAPRTVRVAALFKQDSPKTKSAYSLTCRQPEAIHLLAVKQGLHLCHTWPVTVW